MVRPMNAMNCPKCRTPTLQLATRGAGGLRLDRCTRCGGTWLDYGELAPAAEDPLLPAEPPDAPQPDPGADLRSGPCPRCGIPLRQVPFPSGPFHVDGCPRCGGLFLEPGEFAAVASRHLVDELEQVLPHRPVPPPPAVSAPGAPPPLTHEDRILLARAADLAARHPEAAAFLRAQLDKLAGK
jgi:Zn-finger nucleic acid-binding protein